MLFKVPSEYQGIKPCPFLQLSKGDLILLPTLIRLFREHDQQTVAHGALSDPCHSALSSPRPVLGSTSSLAVMLSCAECVPWLQETLGWDREACRKLPPAAGTSAICTS